MNLPGEEIPKLRCHNQKGSVSLWFPPVSLPTTGEPEEGLPQKISKAKQKRTTLVMLSGWVPQKQDAY